ncbi:DUF3558 domain-containing protein [Nocardia cyriacigeorgica]|uniref:DUF3558 domain-containing protein n=1 Tax=Nocardia cyriacigeorgica TaxID=135487 RepID=UPI0013D3F863|nr:DUF3558 domain-containing protein [Nocardia cyriacigeorgica]NEW27942.1 DUF3558 domain-containing protein [Nocardia cyriacigeorgica]
MSVDNRRFHRAGRVRAAVLLAAVVVGVAGCSGSTEGSPTAVESTAASPESGQTSGTGSATGSTTAKSDEAALWDPCALPESAVSGTGLDAASKETGIAEVDFSDAGWKICSWRSTAGWYDLTIFSGTPTLEDVKARPTFTNYTPKTVGAHEATQYVPVGATKDLECATAVGLEQGVVMIKVQARASKGAQENPCVVVDRHAADLAEYLPEK